MPFRRSGSRPYRAPPRRSWVRGSPLTVSPHVWGLGGSSWPLSSQGRLLTARALPAPHSQSWRGFLLQTCLSRKSPPWVLQPRLPPTLPAGLGHAQSERMGSPGLWSRSPASGSPSGSLCWEGGGAGSLPEPLFLGFLGEILVQMSDTQRHLNSDLEVVVSIGWGHPPRPT